MWKGKLNITLEKIAAYIAFATRAAKQRYNKKRTTLCRERV